MAIGCTLRTHTDSIENKCQLRAAPEAGNSRGTGHNNPNSHDNTDSRELFYESHQRM